MSQSARKWPWHVSLAAFVVIVAGLKMASDLIEPFLLALFVSIVCAPAVAWLRSRGWPEAAAVLVVIFAVLIVLVLGVLGVGASVNSFLQRLPEYQTALAERTGSMFTMLDSIGFGISTESLREHVNAGAVMNFIGDLLGRFGGVLGNFVLVMLTVSFILLEAARFPAKLNAALGESDGRLQTFEHFSEGLQKYLAIKSLVSFGTGALVAVLLFVFDVDYPLLWGALAFLFNYIPNIGSFLAAIPACLLAWLLHGTGTLVLVGSFFIAINMVMGNIVEPRLMGRSLGLSTLVVFLSLVFWGWVLGPIGMILSVPLTMILRIGLENTEDGRWIAILLGPEVPEHVSLPDTSAQGSPEQAGDAGEAENKAMQEAAQAGTRSPDELET